MKISIRIFMKLVNNFLVFCFFFLLANFVFAYDINSFEGIWSGDCNDPNDQMVWKKIDSQSFEVIFYHKGKIAFIHDVVDFKKLDTNRFSYKLRLKNSGNKTEILNYDQEFSNNNVLKIINLSDGERFYYKDGLHISTGHSGISERCSELKTYSSIANLGPYERDTNIPNKRQKLKDLERELKSISDDYEGDVANFKNGRCLNWGNRYYTYNSCEADNDFNSVNWENHLVKKISFYKLKKQETRRAAEDKERCLSNGPIGICQSSKQNELMFLCDTNPIVALNNLGNQYCYTTDNFNIVTNMLVRNNTPNTVRDISFTCQQIANSGTVLGQGSQTVYDSWKPGEVRTVKIKFNKINQVKSMSCSPTRWKN